jgi:hypothetical protein
MKLNHLVPQRYRSQVVRQFGTAKLIRRTAGSWRPHHELVGGTAADYAAALEWSALCAPEIVFSHIRGHARPKARRVEPSRSFWKWWPVSA